MAAKRPTGERPKQLSTLAKTVKSAARGGVASKSGKVEVLTPSQAAARAGKIREKEKAAAKKSPTMKKIKEAKEIAKYRQEYVGRLQTNRQGDISTGKNGGVTIAQQKDRNKAFNSLTSSAKTAGRAKNVEMKLKKAAAKKAK
jgi:hypothetical protein